MHGLSIHSRNVLLLLPLSGMLIWHLHQLKEKLSLINILKGVMLFEDQWVSWLAISLPLPLSPQQQTHNGLYWYHGICNNIEQDIDTVFKCVNNSNSTTSHRLTHLSILTEIENDRRLLLCIHTINALPSVLHSTKHLISGLVLFHHQFLRCLWYDYAVQLPSSNDGT